jgi:hypothetical protein
MSSVWGNQITLPGLYVNGNLSAKQYHFVAWGSTANTVIATAATTDIVAGVLQDAPDAANEGAIVAALGVTVIVAGTSLITAGAALSPDSTGRAITGGVRTYGRSLEASGAIGDEIRMVLGVQ